MQLQELSNLKEEINNNRPIASELMKTIAQKFREEWTYHTNAIEGNTMTLQETSFFLREGLTAKGKALGEHFEVINHSEVVYYLQDAIRDRELSVGLIKEFHAMLFEGVKCWLAGMKISPGAFKNQDNHVLTPSGEIHHYTSAVQVAIEIENLMEWYDKQNDIEHLIVIAAEFHQRFVATHPFQDGNGRVSRLCMNFILMKAGYPPAFIRQEERLDYYLALEQAEKGEYPPFHRACKVGSRTKFEDNGGSTDSLSVRQLFDY